MTVTRIQFFRWIAALAALAGLFCVLPAQAYDRVIWKKTTINESNEAWRLDLEFHFSKPPDIAHVPIEFDFTQTMYYENTLDDSSKEPHVTKQPQENKQPMVETQDVGFMDPGTGKTQARTRFTFKLTRARGFEAGEYKVQLKNKRTGSKIGGETRLILNGTNEVVDRRSISFDEKKKPKADEEKKHSWEEQEYDPSQDPNNDAYWKGGPKESEKDENGDDIPPPAHMQENPGACGCRVPGPAAPGGVAWLLLGSVVSLGWLRRRRARA
jgi:hypothetical protein